MNSYFALTDTPGRRRPRFSQKLRFQPQFAVLPLQFAQPGPVRDRQWWLLIGVLDPILVHPVPEGALVDLDLASHFGDRPGRLDHHLHGLVLEFRTELATTFSQ